jgi:hypothetical protein
MQGPGAGMERLVEVRGALADHEGRVGAQGVVPEGPGGLGLDGLDRLRCLGAKGRVQRGERALLSASLDHARIADVLDDDVRFPGGDAGDEARDGEVEQG